MYWRDRIAQRMAETELAALHINMELVRPFHLDLVPVEAIVELAQYGSPQEKLDAALKANELLSNAIYSAPDLHEPRSKLIQASAAVCGCDGALCRLLGKGRSNDAHELGLHLLPLTRQLARLRLRLREGSGRAIVKDSAKLASDCLTLLAKIRAKTDQ